MPQLKKPVPLEEFAFDFLVRYFVHFCDNITVQDDKFRHQDEQFRHVVHCCDNITVQIDQFRLNRTIVAIKWYMYNHLPGVLFSKFCMRFLHDFCEIGAGRSEERRAIEQKAALEMIMDVGIIGLKCEGRILNFLDPSDAPRLKGLKVLDWSGLEISRHMFRKLENYPLQDLTEFIFPTYCTDLDLTILGLRSSKLERLVIRDSKKITDVGLRALKSCSELRIINMVGCTAVSDNGVYDLLLTHRKLEDFDVDDTYTVTESNSIDLSRPTMLVCPSMKRFVMRSVPVTSADLESAVSLFPNLTDLGVAHSITGDLSLLKNLNNLTKLDFHWCDHGFKVENLKHLLLTNVGANITRLYVPYAHFTQDDLNFIYEVCVNIEEFKFCRSIRDEKLVVPPFQKLRGLHLVVSRNCMPCNWEFPEMVSLKVLGLYFFNRYPTGLKLIKSLMRDNVKFPNLREVRISCNVRDRRHIKKVNHYAITNNIDFSVSMVSDYF